MFIYITKLPEIYLSLFKNLKGSYSDCVSYSIKLFDFPFQSLQENGALLSKCYNSPGLI